MQKKTDQHVFQGMQRDMTISKQKPEFLWDAHNIRLTARHGDTLLSMTNERGTKKFNDIEIKGAVLGYCVLGNYLTVFTKDIHAEPDNHGVIRPDYIYRLEKVGNDFNSMILYNGNLGFELDHPIECLGVYENVDIQKIYWTDGINQPRFINITKNLVDGTYIDTSFDFIPTLQLNDSIHVKKIADSSGLFPAGVVQYAVTYYNKYGQESNISVVSPLIPTSYTMRAGGPEDTIGNAFEITVKNPDTNFEFLRLYSIFRSSKNNTPVCKRVADIRLSYGNSTSRELHTSNDKHISAYERTTLESIMFKEDVTKDFTALSSNTSHIGTENITINGVLFESGHYYHFSKEDYPELILKAQIYNLETETLESNPMQFTWDNNTDIIICETLSGAGNNIYDIWPYGGNSRMIAATEIYYNSIEFINGDEITITDNNTIGEDVDYNELLFVGGEEITAGTLTQKDGTMFFGDITIKRPQITGNYDIIDTDDLPDDPNPEDEDQTPGYIDTELAKRSYDINLVTVIRKGTHIDSSYRESWFPATMNSKLYKWGNTLNAYNYGGNNAGDSTNIAGFKYREHYRLGLQFQYKTGKWSQPVFIKDIEEEIKPDLHKYSTQHVQRIPGFIAEIDSRIGQFLISKDYKRVRAVVCFPTESDQLILCQGILNPTVHSIAGRLDHTPDVQSSWFFRPVPSIDDQLNSIGIPTDADFKVPISYKGGVVQHKHGYTLYSGRYESHQISPTEEHDYTYKQYPTRNDEIQGVPTMFSNMDVSQWQDEDYSNMTLPNVDLNNSSSEWIENLETKSSEYDQGDLSNIFVVDWNYLTFHSPEFEFNDAFCNMDTATVNCRIVAKNLLSSNQGDIHIMTSTSPISTSAPGFYHRALSFENSAFRMNTGPFYRDTYVDYNEDDKFHSLEDSTIGWFLTYPWHRTGSLNNDCARPYDTGNRTAMLSNKVMSNLAYFDTQTEFQTQLNHPDIKIFNSDQISLVKVNNKNYYGNIDMVLSSRFRYLIGRSHSSFYYHQDPRLHLYYIGSSGNNSSNEALGTQEKGLVFGHDPVYMKYKSTPHGVIYTDTTLNLTQNTTYNEGQQNEYTLPKGDFIRESSPYLYQAEIYREPNQSSDFGGTSAMAIHNNIWYPAGPAIQIGCNVDGTPFTDGNVGKTKVPFWYGDTYYQRYDCLKTYPFTDEDINSVIEIGSFMVETRINLDGRYDRNRGNINNFMLNPTNFNLINPVYSQMDNFFNYRILDTDYYALSNYPTMISWTGYKNNAAEVDNWTNVTLASTLEMDGTKGKVNAIRVNSDQLYCFQDDAVGQILFNSRVQISPSDGVPIEISNNYKVDGNRYISTSIGCKNKWTIAEGIDGLYFIDNNTEALYMLAQGQLKPISAPMNMSYWFMSQDCSTPWIQQYWDNPVSYMFKQKGIRCFYDGANSDLYICTPTETLCFSEKLGQFVSFFDYHSPVGMFNIDSNYYALNYSETDPASGIKLWGMLQGVYNTFFDKTYQTDFTLISNENPLNDKIFTNIELRGDFRYWATNNVEDDFNSDNHIVDHRRMFDTIRVWNEYQDTGDIDLRFIDDVPSNMKKKFRIWRMDIPRDKDNTRQRIRNTWAKVKFTMNTLPATSLQDLCGKTSSEFAVWNSNTESWNDLSFTDYTEDGVQYMFRIQNDTSGDYIEKYHIDNTTGAEIADATYVLIGNVIYETYPPIPGRPRPTPHSYAYRKIHDMEIHDIGVVYFM